MIVIAYIKQNINNKIKKQQNLNENNLENINNESKHLIMRKETLTNTKLYLTGDISYNQSFIPKYEIYNNFSLVKNL